MAFTALYWSLSSGCLALKLSNEWARMSCTSTCEVVNMTCLVLVEQQVANLRGIQLVGGINHTDVKVDLSACQGSMAEEMLQLQDTVGIVLDMVATETMP